MEVAWGSGRISKVGPEAIFVVSQDDDDDDDEEGGEGGGDDDDAASWETVDEDEENLSGVRGAVDRSTGADGDKAGHGFTNLTGGGSQSSSLLPAAVPSGLRTALGLFSALAAGGLWSPKKAHAEAADGFARRDTAASDTAAAASADEASCNDDEDDEDTEAAGSSVTLLQQQQQQSAAVAEDAVQRQRCEEAEGRVGTGDAEPSSLQAGRGEQVAGEVSGQVAEQVSGDISGHVLQDGNEAEGRVAEGAARGPSASEGLGFKQFEIVEGAKDHFYFHQPAPSMDRKWMRAVQREWEILKGNLPESIFVRVFEDRMDLLRVAMEAAPATPYSNALFFFDIRLPAEYPSVPPDVSYHSGGLRVNPNLYENGKVCLSLLNTWSGRGSEVWTPGKSTVLQVLVSIQGLVLVPRPYFNEAGYERQRGTEEGERNASLYNENAFLLTCKTIMYQIRRPPKHFEDLVRNHYRSKKSKILASCDAYARGVCVGTFTESSQGSDDSCNRSQQEEINEEDGGGGNEVGSSKGFKILLAKVQPKLEESFSCLEGPSE